jgi:biopolymer transport protein ExbD
MKRLSPLRHKRGRIEIIPLIDIMFFLLAAFMVVSISKIKVDSLKIALPTEVPAAERETKEDFVSISMNTVGQVQIDKQAVASKADLIERLAEMYAANNDQKILISADRETHHGDVMALLSRIRQAGFQRVAFAIKGDSVATLNSSPDTTSAPATSGTPDATPGPLAPSAPATGAVAPASTPAAAPGTPAAAPPAAPVPAGQ